VDEARPDRGATSAGGESFDASAIRLATPAFLLHGVALRAAPVLVRPMATPPSLYRIRRAVSASR
jgi:hypothetical protein